MKNTIKKILAVFICICCIFSSGCEEGKGDGPKKSGGNVEVWTADGATKILRDRDCSALPKTRTLLFNAFGNEYEEGQIILSPECDIDSYRVELCDLKNAGGDVLKKECFTIFNEKYILVDKLLNTQIATPLGVGFYPDALLPFEKAVEYGENRVNAGENQGIWVSLKVPAGQKPGAYSGNFTVKADGKDYNVPVNANIYDYTLSGETHIKSSFGLYLDVIARGEYDSSLEMFDTYYNFMLDHRIDPQDLPVGKIADVVLRGEALDRFLYYAHRSTTDERCSHYNIPFCQCSPFYTEDGDMMYGVDFVEFENTLREMAKYSAENGVNLFKKAGTYFIIFDECDLNGTENIANYNVTAADKVCEDVAADLQGKLVSGTCSEELEAGILKDLAGLKHKVVFSSFKKKLSVDKVLYVPLLPQYETAKGRKVMADLNKKAYGDDSELWTYVAGGPRAPYPTLHIEDRLLPSRLLGWILYRHNIKGLLYWESAMYERWIGDNRHGQLYDFYATANRADPVNGDGFFMYPGRPYGIHGPVDTVRFQSIRNGCEDYDLLYAFENYYKNYGIEREDFDTIMTLFLRDLSTGAHVNYNENMNADFAKTRELLGRLLEIAANTGAVVKKFTKGSVDASFEIVAPKGVRILSGGTELAGTENGENTEYSVSVPFEKDENYLDLEVVKDDKRYAAHIYVGGKCEVVNIAGFSDKFDFITGGSVEETAVDDTPFLKVNVLADEKGRAVADVNVSSLNIDMKSFKNVILDLYNYGEEEAVINIRSKCRNAQIYDIAKSVTLKPGHNLVGITPSELGCGNFGMLEVLRFDVAGGANYEFALGPITLQR